MGSSSGKLAEIGAVVIHIPFLEAVKSQKWRVGSPTVVTYIHRLSNPPPPWGTYTCMAGFMAIMCFQGVDNHPITCQYYSHCHSNITQSLSVCRPSPPPHPPTTTTTTYPLPLPHPASSLPPFTGFRPIPVYPLLPTIR